MAISHGFSAKYFNGEGHGKVCYARAGKNAACIENLKFDAAECGANGDSALFLSIENRHQRTTIFLIENGADVCKCDICGETPLHSAAARNGLKENVKLLILNGGDFRFGCLDLKADPNPTHSHPEQPPFFAILKAINRKCVELLILKAGADPLDRS